MVYGECRFKNISERSAAEVVQLVALLLSFPCFKASHFFFKLVYMFNQRRLLRLCGKDLFLKLYDRRVSDGSVVDILQSLRRIEQGLKDAEAGDYINRHAFSVNGGTKLVHPGGAKLVHLTLCGTRCWGVVPVVHRRDPRCFV